MKSIKRLKIRRVAQDGVMMALYYVFSMLTISAGNLRISFASLPVIICALLYGPADAAIVGLLGEFLAQVLKWGITQTTALWILPPAVRGLYIGVIALIILKTGKLPERCPAIYYITCITAAIMTTLVNTLAIYIDSRVFGYYTPELVMGDFTIRVFSGILTAVILSSIAVPVVYALRRLGYGKNINCTELKDETKKNDV